MSLINEALKRAQEAQAQVQGAQTPDRNIELQPAAPGSGPGKTRGWLLPCGLTAAALLTAFCIYQAIRPNPSAQQVQARSPGPTVGVIPNPPVQSGPQVAAPTLDPPRKAANEQVAGPLAAPTELQKPAPMAGTNTNVVVVSDSAQGATPAKPAPRLQGIVYSQSRPSAVINNKTVFVGDKVGDMRVLVIDQESVTLFGGGQTNVLTLP